MGSKTNKIFQDVRSQLFFLEENGGGFSIINKWFSQSKLVIHKKCHINIVELLHPYKEMSWIFTWLVGKASMAHGTSVRSIWYVSFLIFYVRKMPLSDMILFPMRYFISCLNSKKSRDFSCIHIWLKYYLVFYNTFEKLRPRDETF